MDSALIRRFAIRLVAALSVMQSASLAAQAVPEYKMKAAFVYNFALFTDWPTGVIAEGGSLNICIHPESPLRTALMDLSGKVVKGRHVVIKQLDALDALRNCHVLFVDSMDRERWGQIKKGLVSISVLTVSDDGDISRDGAVIGLHLENNRVGFDVDMSAAKQAHLVLSSKLLRLARTVQ